MKIKLSEKDVKKGLILSKDINENIGSTELTLFVRKRSLIGNILSWLYENIIKKFWWAFLTIFIATVIFYKRDWEIKYLSRKLLKTQNKQEELKNLQVETEKRYYNDGSITKKEFQKLKQHCEKREINEREKEKAIKGRLEKLQMKK